MYIRRDSWHYKLRHWDGFEIQDDNLCKYFWGIVLRLMIASLIITLFIVLLIRCIIEPFTMFAVAFPFSLVFVPMLAIKGLRTINKGPARLPKENLLIEYLKARKNKVCPMIEYVGSK